jgi:hypothetical protein
MRPRCQRDQNIGWVTANSYCFHSNNVTALSQRAEWRPSEVTLDTELQEGRAVPPRARTMRKQWLVSYPALWQEQRRITRQKRVNNSDDPRTRQTSIRRKQLTTCSRVLVESPVVQPFKNFSACYRIRMFISVFTRAFHWSLSRTTSNS